MKLNYEELKLAAYMTRDWPEGSGIHTDIHYDRSTGHVWTRTEYGEEFYTLSGNPDEIIVAKTVRRTGVAELLAAIDKAVALDDQCRAYLQGKTNGPEA
ncbi:MAG: hypothetical protein PUH63_01065 [Firmicutes bacterium]|nr:hypothetical protein [Bacillota bacterium]